MKKAKAIQTQGLQKKDTRLVIVGLSGSGKSTISIKFIQGHFMDHYDPTIEDTYRKRVVVEGEPEIIEILDTCGDADGQWSPPMVDELSHADGVLFVYSVCQRDSYDYLHRDFRDSFRKHVGTSWEPRPGMVVGNKTDLEDKAVSTEEGQQLADDLGVPFVEISTKRDDVDPIFHEIISQCRGWENFPGPVREAMPSHLIPMDLIEHTTKFMTHRHFATTQHQRRSQEKGKEGRGGCVSM